MAGGQPIPSPGGQSAEEQAALGANVALARALEGALRDAAQARGADYLERFRAAEREKIDADFAPLPDMPQPLVDMREAMRAAAQEALDRAVDGARDYSSGRP